MIAEVVVIAITVLGCFAMQLYAAREQSKAVRVALEAASASEAACKQLVEAAERHEALTKKVLLEHNERLMNVEFWKSKQAMR